MYTGEHMTPFPNQVVVCAAMRKDEVIVTGARHFDPIMRVLVALTCKGHVGWEQGFIDQRGQFLTRQEAWRIADANGQIRRPTGWEA